MSSLCFLVLYHKKYLSCNLHNLDKQNRLPRLYIRFTLKHTNEIVNGQYRRPLHRLIFVRLHCQIIVSSTDLVSTAWQSLESLTYIIALTILLQYRGHRLFVRMNSPYEAHISIYMPQAIGVWCMIHPSCHSAAPSPSSSCWVYLSQHLPHPTSRNQVSIHM